VIQTLDSSTKSIGFEGAETTMTDTIEKTSSAERVERLETVLAGAMRAGDIQADELIRLSGINARQSRAMWRALSLMKRGRYSDATLVIETDLLSRDRKEPADDPR
jgi:hypothetical protein